MKSPGDDCCNLCVNHHYHVDCKTHNDIIMSDLVPDRMDLFWFAFGRKWVCCQRHCFSTRLIKPQSPDGAANGSGWLAGEGSAGEGAGYSGWNGGGRGILWTNLFANLTKTFKHVKCHFGIEINHLFKIWVLFCW